MNQSRTSVVRTGYETNGIVVLGEWGVYNGRKHWLVRCKICGKEFHSQTGCVVDMKSCGCTRGGRHPRKVRVRDYEKAPKGGLDPEILERVRAACSRPDEEDRVSLKPMTREQRIYIEHGRADRWQLNHIPDYGQRKEKCQI